MNRKQTLKRTALTLLLLLPLGAREAEAQGALPHDGRYRVVVFVEDTPDDPDEAALRRLKLSLRFLLKVTLR